MLANGLYEQIINKHLDTELASTDKLSQTAPIDTAEAPKSKQHLCQERLHR